MSSQRDELVAARADAILADMDAAGAYAAHFEAQVHAVRLEARVYLSQTRRLLAPLRLLRRPGVILLAVSLVPCALFGYSFATTGLAPVTSSGTNGLAAVSTASGRLAAMTSLPGPPGAVTAADGSVWVADPSAGHGPECGKPR
jgi:hypothetical protein